MMRVSWRQEPLRLPQLSSCLPQEAQQLINGISSKEQAWEELDAKYVNRGITTLQTMNKLVQADLPADNKVKALVNYFRTASNCLKAVGAAE